MIAELIRRFPPPRLSQMSRPRKIYNAAGQEHPHAKESVRLRTFRFGDPLPLSVGSESTSLCDVNKTRHTVSKNFLMFCTPANSTGSPVLPSASQRCLFPAWARALCSPQRRLMICSREVNQAKTVSIHCGANERLQAVMLGCLTHCLLPSMPHATVMRFYVWNETAPTANASQHNTSPPRLFGTTASAHLTSHSGGNGAKHATMIVTEAAACYEAKTWCEFLAKEANLAPVFHLSINRRTSCVVAHAPATRK